MGTTSRAMTRRSPLDRGSSATNRWFCGLNPRIRAGSTVALEAVPPPLPVVRQPACLQATENLSLHLGKPDMRVP